MARTVLLDGDIYVYQLGSAAEVELEWSADEWTLHAHAGPAKEQLRDKVERLADGLNADAKPNRCSSPHVRNDRGGGQRGAWITRSAHDAHHPRPGSGDHDLRPHPCPALDQLTPRPALARMPQAQQRPTSLGTWEALALVQGDRLPR